MPSLKKKKPVANYTCDGCGSRYHTRDNGYNPPDPEYHTCEVCGHVFIDSRRATKTYWFTLVERVEPKKEGDKI